MLRTARLPALCRGAVAALAVVVYLGTLGHGFVFDDEITVTLQQVVREHRFADVFTTPYHAGTGGVAGTGLYRPLTVLSFVVQDALHGPRPGAYHAVNVLLHAIVSVLVFELALALALPLGAALGAGALFALHPVHVEAVAGIAGRPELLSALFFLLALVVFLRVPTRTGLVAAAAALLLALGAKENAIVFPVVALGAQILVRRRRAILPALVACAVPIVIYLAARGVVLGSLLVPSASVSRIENPVVGLPILGRIATVLAMAARYAILLVFPRDLSPDWGYAEVVPVASLLDPWFLSGAALVVACTVGAFAAVRRHGTIAFALLFGGAAWFIVSNIPVVIGVGMAERLLYLPSVAFCLLAAVLAARLHSRAGTRATAGIAAIVLVAAAARTWAGAAAWKDELALFAAAERHAPRSIKVLGNLAAQLAARGSYEQARRRLDRAAALAPEHIPTAINLSGVLLNIGDFDGAERVARSALAIDSRDAVLHAQLGAILRKKGILPEAEDAFRMAIELDPSFARARLDLAGLLLSRGDVIAARRQLEAVLAVDPGSTAAKRGLEIAAELERARGAGPPLAN